MWADPVDTQTGNCEGIVMPNKVRGCSYFFGYELSRNFL